MPVVLWLRATVALLEDGSEEVFIVWLRRGRTPHQRVSPPRPTAQGIWDMHRALFEEVRARRLVAPTRLDHVASSLDDVDTEVEIARQLAHRDVVRRRGSMLRAFARDANALAR
jgi:hypothetical protein